MKVGYLGPKATFSDLAVRGIFPAADAIPYSTIPICIDAVLKDEVNLSVVPLENTLEGSVNITLDYLIHEAHLPIEGEVTVPIQQHLMVHPRHVNDWGKIEKVFSHAHAIAQCHKFLHRELKGVPCENTTSTAAAAQFVKQHKENAIAAIANELAAQEYGLEIVKRNIHDFDFNHTRFIILAKKSPELPMKTAAFKGYKTTLMITLPLDRSGALHQVLSAFAWRQLNLIKIESRPTKTGLGNYFFIIDIDRKMDDVLIPGAIAELEVLDCKVDVLGSYPYFQLT
ncbi:prephenate dehydratase [Bacillaceae bacterium Marseille-Q3522]|nr:prephenate dehydratase [Bacillaceae bacterium Marseille-Q3522]